MWVKATVAPLRDTTCPAPVSGIASTNTENAARPSLKVSMLNPGGLSPVLALVSSNPAGTHPARHGESVRAASSAVIESCRINAP